MPAQPSAQLEETEAATLQECWREDARTDLSFFAEYTSRGRWKPAPHLVLIAKIIQDRLEQGGARMILTVPPRHGKSNLVSERVPPFIIGDHPDWRVMLASYEASFAASWGGKARDIMEEYGDELFGLKVKDDSSAKASWGIEGHEGGMTTAGVGGPLTGKGANVLIIDDPVKNDKEANSQVYRDAVWEWFRATAYTRIEPGGSCIVIMTRWHEDDLVGRLIKDAEEGGEKWEVINLPAIAGEDDLMGRAEGEALWPERFPVKELARIKRMLGSYWWAALYQQTPQAEDGEIFKRSQFRYFYDDGMYFVLHKPEGEKRFQVADCEIFQTCDAAATEKESSDYFVLGTWAVTPDSDLLLLDLFREKAETTKHEEIMKNGLLRWKPFSQFVENATYGLALLQALVKKGYPVQPLKADKDKVSRARTMAARYEVGTVYHRLGAPWLTDYEDEMIAFPRGAHDDQVDVASYAAIVLIDQIGDAYEDDFEDALDLGGF